MHHGAIGAIHTLAPNVDVLELDVKCVAHGTPDPTHLSEIHWLQNTHQECNPNFQPGNYDGCEPYYFNHARESVPMTLFFDGHIEGLGTMEATAADSRASRQSPKPAAIANPTHTASVVQNETGLIAGP